MLKRLAIVVFLAIVLPVYGQKEGPKPGSDKGYGNGSESPSGTPSGTATCIVKREGTAIECQWPKDEPKSYFERFASPENLPNIGLMLVGFGGIIAAVCTLLAIKEQTRETARAAKAAEESNTQTAEFFMTEKRPWVGIIGDAFVVVTESERTGYRALKLEYTIKNFGVAPAFNVVVPFSAPVEEASAYDLVKSRINEARRNGENILTITGDLLLPGAEKMGSCEFSPAPKSKRFTMAGCVVYRFADGSIHHTELSYFVDWQEGERAKCRTAWFQAAD